MFFILVKQSEIIRYRLFIKIALASNLFLGLFDFFSFVLFGYENILLTLGFAIDIFFLFVFYFPWGPCDVCQ